MTYIIITSPDGQHQWRNEAAFVPRVGETVACRQLGKGEILFQGEVTGVDYQVAAEHDDATQSIKGMVVWVWTKEIEK